MRLWARAVKRHNVFHHLTYEAGRCRLTPGFRSRPHACFQCLKLKYDKLLSNFAFKCNLRRYNEGSVDVHAITDPDQRAAVEARVDRRSFNLKVTFESSLSCFSFKS